MGLWVEKLEVGVDLEGQVGDVVVDAHRETRSGSVLRQLVVDGLGHGGGELLAGKAVATADQHRHDIPVPASHGFPDRGGNVEEQRFASRTGFLGAVQDCDLPHGGGQRVQEVFLRERPVEPHEQDTHLLPRLVEVPDYGDHRLDARTHDHHHPVGLGVTVVLHQGVLATRDLRESFHRLGENPGNGVVVAIRGLTGLEVGVRVLRGTANEGILGAQCSGTVLANQVGGNQVAQLVVGELDEGVEFVTGAETVEEMHERQPGTQGRQMRHGRHVVGLLHRCGTEHAAPRLTHGHHVLVVAENRQPLRSQGPRRDVEDRGGQLPGDPVHVGDHQQQALRGGEGGGQGPALEGTVHGAGCSALGLHLDDGGDRTEDILTPVGGPLIGQFGHGGAGGDRVDGAEFAQPVGDVRRGLVAVDDGALVHHWPSGIISMACTGHCS